MRLPGNDKRNTAARHGGAVLVDYPEGMGTRVTLTFGNAPEGENQSRANQPRADYAGEQDHALIELSEFLPLSYY